MTQVKCSRIAANLHLPSLAIANERGTPHTDYRLVMVSSRDSR